MKAIWRSTKKVLLIFVVFLYTCLACGLMSLGYKELILDIMIPAYQNEPYWGFLKEVVMFTVYPMVFVMIFLPGMAVSLFLENRKFRMERATEEDQNQEPNAYR